MCVSKGFVHLCMSRIVEMCHGMSKVVEHKSPRQTKLEHMAYRGSILNRASSSYSDGLLHICRVMMLT